MIKSDNFTGSNIENANINVDIEDNVNLTNIFTPNILVCVCVCGLNILEPTEISCLYILSRNLSVKNLIHQNKRFREYLIWQRNFSLF